MSLFFTTVTHQDDPEIKLALTIEEELNGAWAVKSGTLYNSKFGENNERNFTADEYPEVLRLFDFDEAEVGIQVEEKLEKHHADDGIL